MAKKYNGVNEAKLDKIDITSSSRWGTSRIYH